MKVADRVSLPLHGKAVIYKCRGRVLSTETCLHHFYPRPGPSSSFHTFTANRVFMEMECAVSLSLPEPAVLPSRASSSGFQFSHQSPRSNTSRRWVRRYKPDPHSPILPVSLPQSNESKTTVRRPGQQFVDYFTMRRTDTNCRSCIFICWTQGNLAKVVDIPFTLDELNDEKQVFERLRENFFRRRGYMRTFFYSAYPEQAKAIFQNITLYSF
jgi:hypothetical protein